MSEMVDRMAEAIQIAAECHLMWNDLSQDAAARYRFQARAAIKAIREPTSDMTKAARGAAASGHSKTMWRAMIDAALGPEPRPATAGDV